ncbi:MAG TPA: methyltransferase domain-containing protein, partial [Gaiellaceae bacterium]|nr:methyltransferase domain-containing protein [Gaiellaceae bacterium]
MTDRDALDVLRDQVLDGASLEDGDDVLDLGDGSGLLAGELRARIGDGWVYAVARDVGTLEKLLRSAHEQGIAGVAYLVGDPDVLPLPDASVDVVVGGGVFTGTGAGAGAARELYRVLRPGGRLSLVEGDGLADAVGALRDAGFVDEPRVA